MTPRSSCPGGEYYSSPGRKPPAHYEINTVTETAPHFARLPAGLCPSYKLPGSFLASTGGSVLARAEASARKQLLRRGFPNHESIELQPMCIAPQSTCRN